VRNLKQKEAKLKRVELEEKFKMSFVPQHVHRPRKYVEMNERPTKTGDPELDKMIK